ALGEDAVFVQRHQRAKRARIEAFGKNYIGRAIALEDPERSLPIRHPFGLDLLLRLSEGQRLCLGELVTHQNILLAPERAERLQETDKIARDELRSLVDQLIEGMLPIRARLAPDDGARLVVHMPATQVDMLAVALHLQLLEVGRKARERRRIGHDA